MQWPVLGSSLTHEERQNSRPPKGRMVRGFIVMEKMIKIHLERLPEGVYLATSDDIQGLVAQGRTVAETIEIARDVARKLIEEQGFPTVTLGTIADSFEYPLIVGT
jgi:predicted RNase H-like HicB family nuclease